MKKNATARHGAFTLVEILVVLAIIGILAAILFPAFSRAQEGGRQTNCASNLNQVYIAVNQYFQDTRRYPDSLVDLLPQGAKYNPTVPPAASTEAVLTTGTDYLKGGTDLLLCLDDDADTLHSSYGALTKVIGTATAATIAATPGRYVFNYWGYKKDGFTLNSPAEVEKEVGAAASPLLRDPSQPYKAANPLENPFAYSLSNRYAPATTIITHCVFIVPARPMIWRCQPIFIIRRIKSRRRRRLCLATERARAILFCVWTAPRNSPTFRLRRGTQ